jgi:hypothetical protein
MRRRVGALCASEMYCGLGPHLRDSATSGSALAPKGETMDGWRSDTRGMKGDFWNSLVNPQALRLLLLVATNGAGRHDKA